MNRNFGIANSVKGSVKQCTPDLLAQAMDAEVTKGTCAEIEDALEKVKRGEMSREDFETFKGEHKKRLPIITPHAMFPKGRRCNCDAVASGLSMYDIDHISDPRGYYHTMVADRVKDLGIVFAHVTPSLEGLRLIFVMPQGMTLEEAQGWMSKQLGDANYDGCVKDMARSSFVVPRSYVLYMDEEEMFNVNVNPNLNHNLGPTSEASDLNQREARLNPEASAEDLNQRSDLNFKGIPYTTIIEEYWKKTGGEPEEGERNVRLYQLAVNLRAICDNKREVLMAIMPRLGLDEQELKSIIDSACKEQPKGISKVMREIVNDNGNGNYDDGEDEVNVNVPVRRMPEAPPVIKELISIAPKDFVVPAINSLLPILGTLTSYVRAEDKSNAKTLSTSFFSIIYAPPSSGKSFVERYINMLFKDLYRRDEINEAKDAVFARSQQQKSANDRSEAVPQTSIRIMEAKNSEAEFLEKQRNNQGHHMFTYCSEIDQWRKGIRAAGGNKDDMVRIAWDNGKYGQNFKSCNTFKGKVSLYWNVLIAGTSDQLMAYFNNVTNGLVTRCSFAEIENQQFLAKAPKWGKLSQKDMKVIDAFIERCDRKTYAEPLTYNPKDCYGVSDKDFDEEVPWHFTFKPFEQASIDWITKTVDKFNEAQCNKARIDSDEARDTFRRRVAERGKRLALLCTQLYGETMTKQDKDLCKKWIMWWMEQDIENILKPFGKKYIEATQEAVIPSYRGKTILQRMGEEFSASDVQRTARILGHKTPPKQIIYYWLQAGVVEKFATDRWRKVKLSDKKIR